MAVQATPVHLGAVSEWSLLFRFRLERVFEHWVRVDGITLDNITMENTTAKGEHHSNEKEAVDDVVDSLRSSSSQNVYFSVVYAKYTPTERRTLRDQMQHISNILQSTPWIIEGDFNVITSSSEYAGNSRPPHGGF
ncbi:hypothetical protein ACH5RR_021764 [Cinchona calisaya]|uniref:Endonuclease/exonuclease/phosphatase domain-containing protein n=1 Tax=Cinchona calisaya TaxID=153742 RepID=A0ABD2ZLF6_9GENT